MSNTWSLKVDSGPTTFIRAPHRKGIRETYREVVHQTLSARYSRDFIGEKKKVLSCEWAPALEEEFNTIMAAYDAQRTGSNVLLVVDEDGFYFSGNVIISITDEYIFSAKNIYDLRNFRVVFYEA